jgi:hypothetical protein
MLFRHIFLRCLMSILVGCVCGQLTSCIPTTSILLSNCSFRYVQYSTRTTIPFESHLLSMIVPYALNQTEEDELLISIITHRSSSKPLIRFNLNLIQCTNMPVNFHWTSLESSSTISGEFVRTSSIDKNIMYLPAGVTYLKNFTSIDCSTKTFYRTDQRQLFQLDLRIESTLNDTCMNDEQCYPIDTYRCHADRHRCTCREPFQSYFIQEQYPICVHAVSTIEQCTMKHVRCFQWCHENSSSMCLCPNELTTKKFTIDQRGEKHAHQCCHFTRMFL